MTDEHRKDALDALLFEAKGVAPGPDLMARVLADAASIQTEVPTVAVAPRGTWLAGLVGAIGGWSALSGVTAAGVMGLAVGLYSPESVVSLLDSGAVPIDIGPYHFTPDLGDLWTEDGDV